MMPCLLWRDPARFLQVSQPARVVPGHHVAARQVNVVMTAPHRGHPRAQAHPDELTERIRQQQQLTRPEPESA